LKDDLPELQLLSYDARLAAAAEGEGWRNDARLVFRSQFREARFVSPLTGLSASVLSSNRLLRCAQAA